MHLKSWRLISWTGSCKSTGRAIWMQVGIFLALQPYMVLYHTMIIASSTIMSCRTDFTALKNTIKSDHTKWTLWLCAAACKSDTTLKWSSFLLWSVPFSLNYFPSLRIGTLCKFSTIMPKYCWMNYWLGELPKSNMVFN